MHSMLSFHLPRQTLQRSAPLMTICKSSFARKGPQSLTFQHEYGGGDLKGALTYNGARGLNVKGRGQVAKIAHHGEMV